MLKVYRSTIIDAPISKVWAILRDFNSHERWHPAIAQSQIEAGLTVDQIGAIRSFTLTGGERLREQLLSLDDQKHHLRYSIVESEVPLLNYVAEIGLKPLTSENKTFWSWSSEFKTPVGREEELAGLVATNIYQAGFEAIQALLATEKPPAKVATGVNIGSSAGLDGTAMLIDHFGGPEVLHSVAVKAPAPGPGEVRLQQSAIGVNYFDIYCRNGAINSISLPAILGIEAVGVVESVGANVYDLKVGQRVGYAAMPIGAYTSVRTVDAKTLVLLPDHWNDNEAAAGLLKGMTAEFLLHRVHLVQPGETLVVYAPAGGVGRLLCQWAVQLGATVIGVTSNQKKANIARALGVQHVVLSTANNSIEKQILELTQGQGADVIYDPIGKDSFLHSWAALAKCGHLVSFGQITGPIGNWDINALEAKSAKISKPNFAHYTDTPEKISGITQRVFDAIERRIIIIETGHSYALNDAPKAHQALEERTTTATSVLIPNSSP